MRRAGIFTVLTILLLAVAGVTAAQEGVFSGDRPEETRIDEKSPKPANPAPTEPEKTEPKNSEQPADENRSLKDDEERVGSSAKSKEDIRKARTVYEPEPEEERGKATAASAGVAKGKAEGKGKAAGKAKGKGKAADKVKEQSTGEDEAGGGQQKVALCHKGKKTITVARPAEAAHLSHGDSPGPCGTEPG